MNCFSRYLAVSAVAAAAAVGTAQAASSAGEFVAPAGGFPAGSSTSANTTPDGGASFEWGQNVPSALTFAPAVLENAPGTFSLGTLRYENRTSDIGTGADFVDFNLSLDDVFGTSVDILLPLRFQIINTPNDFVGEISTTHIRNFDSDVDPREFIPLTDLGFPAGPQPWEFLLTDPENADKVHVLDSTPLTAPVDIPGFGLYDVTISFQEISPDAFVSDAGTSFEVIEEGNATGTIIGTFSPFLPPPAGVPDSGSTLALLGSAIASISLIRRMRRSA